MSLNLQPLKARRPQSRGLETKKSPSLRRKGYEKDMATKKTNIQVLQTGSRMKANSVTMMIRPWWSQQPLLSPFCMQSMLGTLHTSPPLFFCFLGPPLWHLEIPRLGVKSELHLLAYATGTATLDPSHIWDLYHSSWQHRILNPLSEARDRTHIPKDTSQVTHWATVGTPYIYFF